MDLEKRCFTNVLFPEQKSLEICVSTVVSGSERHPYSLAGMSTGFDWGFQVFVSCKLWFQYRSPVCSPQLPQGSRGRQGQSGRDAEAQLWQWKWNEYSQRDVPVPALLPELLWWVLPAQQMAGTERLCCASGKLLSFVGPVHVCGCVRGEVGQTCIYLIIFKRERETNGSLRLKKLLAYEEPVSCFRGMRHVCLHFEFSAWFHKTFLISQDCEFF